MRRLLLILFLLGMVLLRDHPASAQIEMPRSVIANGAGALAGAGYSVSGSTLGQAAIGIVSGPSNINEIGFWYRPRWITDVEEPPQKKFWFGQNFPNPFNPVTTLQFFIPKRSHVTIKLYDVSGREVITVVDEDLGPGRHTRILHAGGLSSGIYFCRMKAAGFVETRKIVLLK
jgi:hypothetical protein